jgi:transposase, IS30 family
LTFFSLKEIAMSYNQLTEVERYQVYSLLKTGMKPSGIAEPLGRHPSTIGRELKRNRGLRGYRPAQAQRLAKARQAQATKHRKPTEEVKGWIVQLIRQGLSPEQVAGYLARHRQVDLHRHLRAVSKPYRKRYGHYGRRGRIKDRASIEARPDIVASRGRLGGWEGDTVIYPKGTRAKTGKSPCRPW